MITTGQRHTNGELNDFTEVEMETLREWDPMSPDTPTIRMKQSFASAASILYPPSENDGQKSCCVVPIFLPFGRFIFCWNFFLLILMSYSVLEIPYTFCFDVITLPTDPWVIIGFLIDICLLVDVFINFRTGYVHPHDRLRIIWDTKLIAKRYLKTWFVVDLLASTPFTYFILIAEGGEPNGDNDTIWWFWTFKFLRGLKLFRIFKILNMRYRLREFLVGRYYQLNPATRRLMKMFRIVLLMVLSAHYAACIWHLIGKVMYKRGHPSWLDKVEANDDIDKGNLVRYSYAFYWSIVTLFTTGYGDIVATNMYEQWMCSCTILIGSCFFAYLIGVLSEGLRDDPHFKQVLKRKKQSQAFCAHYNFPDELKTAVCSHINYYTAYNYNFDEKEMMSLLPNHIQKQVWHHLAVNRLKEMDIFEKIDDDVVGQIALRMKRKSVGEHQKLFQRGDIGRELYIQRAGKSKLIYGQMGKPPRILFRGDVVGEESLFDRKRQDTVICIAWSEFFVLQIDDIFNVLTLNYGPRLAKKKWNKMRNLIRATESNTNLLGDHCPHRRVVLDEIPPRACSHPECGHATTLGMTNSERQLQMEEEENRDLELTKKRSTFNESQHNPFRSNIDNTAMSLPFTLSAHAPTFRSLRNLFLDRQDSHSRHRKVMKHHKKFRQKSVAYSYLTQESTMGSMDEDDDDFGRDDFEFTNDYLDHSPAKLKRKSSNASNSSSESTELQLTSDDFEDTKTVKSHELHDIVDHVDAENRTEQNEERQQNEQRKESGMKSNGKGITTKVHSLPGNGATSTIRLDQMEHSKNRNTLSIGSARNMIKILSMSVDSEVTKESDGCSPSALHGGNAKIERGDDDGISATQFGNTLSIGSSGNMLKVLSISVDSTNQSESVTASPLDMGRGNVDEVKNGCTTNRE